MTTAEFFTEWLEDERHELKRSTYEAYITYVNRHIIPWFSEHANNLKMLKPRDIKNYINYIEQGGRLDNKSGGLSRASVSKHLSVLKQAFNEAVFLEYLPVNPAAPIRLKRSKRVYTKRAVMLTTEEAQRLIEAFKGHYLYEAVVLSLYYGLRRSEVLGLKWSAIDLEKNQIRIEHTVVKSLTIEAADETKTLSSMAVFPMFQDVREMLIDLKERSPQNMEYLFLNKTQTDVMRPDCMTRGFQRRVEKMGFPHMRFHDLRHSTASILFDKGMPVDDVRIWLRHDDIETTMNIYVHWTNTRTKKISENIDGIFNIS